MKFNKLTRSDRRCLSGQISPTLLPSHLGWPWLNYLISQEISAESSKWNPSLWLTRREAREFLSWNIDPPIIFPNKAGLPLCGVASVYFEVSARVLFLWLSDTVRPIIQVAGVREKESWMVATPLLLKSYYYIHLNTNNINIYLSSLVGSLVIQC